MGMPQRALRVSATALAFCLSLGEGGEEPGRSLWPSPGSHRFEVCARRPARPFAPHPWEPLLLTRSGEEVRVVVVSLMQRVMGVRSQEGGGGHEGIAIV